MPTRRTLFSSNNAAFGPVSLRLVLGLVLVMLAQDAAAQQVSPETIAYQGYLTNTDGDPANGTTTVVFRLYDQATGGTELWEETQQNVVFTDGVFSAHLGAVESLEEVSFGSALWLSISVAGSEELSPRVVLEAVPYALSVRGLRVEPSDVSPNMIGGHVGNTVTNAQGATIGGGGTSSDPNTISGSGATISGGIANNATELSSTIGGGAVNEASGRYSTVGGGERNTAGGRNAAVSGGQENTASEAAATVGGGLRNTASGSDGTVSGGRENTASGTAATVGGGQGNSAESIGATVSGGGSNAASGEFSTTSGGLGNATLGTAATVGGGNINAANGDYATVGGGLTNRAEGDGAAVGGGVSNTAASNNATVAGGNVNEANGPYSMVPGGAFNTANGDYSFAAGFRAQAEHDGSFVWAGYFDIQDAPFLSTAPRQFLIRAAGGVGIGTNTPQGALHTNNAIVGEPDLVVGGASNDPDGIIASDPTLSDSELFLLSNRNVGIKLDSDDDQDDQDGASFLVANGDEDLLLIVRENGLMSVAELEVTGQVTADTFRADEALGDTDTPEQGGVYQDNVIYAWANVQGNGTVVSSYGCTVSKITGFGSYRVTFNQPLPEGVSAIVTVQTLNDPVIATAVADQNKADVATKVFNGAAFVPADYGFYIQVVGRP